MRWYNHKMVAGISVYALTGSVLGAMVSAAGSLLPDVLEFRGLMRHRALSHWPYPYLVIIGLMFVYAREGVHLWCVVGIYLLSGTLAHLLGDFCSRAGIPWKMPQAPPTGLNLYKTHALSEEVFAIMAIISFSGLAYSRGFLSGEFIRPQITLTLVFIVKYLIDGVRWVMT